MAIVKVQELVDAGVHFGHRSSRWNPKMRPYIYGKRNLIHIIDLRETLRGLLRAYKYVTKIVSQGKLVMFVGTKRQAKEMVEREAKRCGMPSVSERWLGGTLTNFRTIRSRLQRLADLESLEASGQIQTYSKKMISSINRERKKIDRNLAGIRDMNRIPEALIVIDPHKEHIAVKEARKMGITVVALIDTDSDPDTVDLAIPGNDDSIRSIELILSKLAQAVIEGKAGISPEMQKQIQRQTREPETVPRRKQKKYKNRSAPTGSLGASLLSTALKSGPKTDFIPPSLYKIASYVIKRDHIITWFMTYSPPGINCIAIKLLQETNNALLRINIKLIADVIYDILGAINTPGLPELSSLINDVVNEIYANRSKVNDVQDIRKERRALEQIALS